MLGATLNNKTGVDLGQLSGAAAPDAATAQSHLKYAKDDEFYVSVAEGVNLEQQAAYHAHIQTHIHSFQNQDTLTTLDKDTSLDMDTYVIDSDLNQYDKANDEFNGVIRSHSEKENKDFVEADKRLVFDF